MKAKLPPMTIKEEGLLQLFPSYDQYIIPFFQRNYSWEEKQIKELLEDIIENYENKDYSLIGTVELLTFDRRNFYVVDGQQRLSTLFMIVDACAELSKPEYGYNNYPRLREVIQDLRYTKDNYGFIIGDKVVRENKEGIKTPLIISEEIKSYLNIKVKELIEMYPNFFEKGGLYGYITSNVNLMKKVYFSTDKDIDKNETFSTILNHFYKLNVRGKPFDNSEIEEIVKNLDSINKPLINDLLDKPIKENNIEEEIVINR